MSCSLKSSLGKIAFAIVGTCPLTSAFPTSVKVLSNFFWYYEKVTLQISIAKDIILAINQHLYK